MRASQQFKISMQQFSKKQILIIIGVAVIILIVILAFTVGRKPTKQQAVSLTFWGVNDSKEIWEPILSAYQKQYPNVKIQYTAFNEVNYESSLLDALAAGTGPDVFMFHRSWLPKHYNKIYSFDTAKMSPSKLAELFPEVIEQDFSDGQYVYSLPLYLDSLATIYNKDVFNAAAVALVPKTWQEFEVLTPKLKKIDSETNAIIRAAGAIGGSNKSIYNASDILSLIMMQSGVSFPKNSSERLSFFLTGQEPLDFYLSFSNPKSLVYTWNDGFFQSSLDDFANGKIAIIFDYQSAIKTLKKKNPYLNFGVASMLQLDLDKPVNLADYWGLAISSKSKNLTASQDFILTITTDETLNKAYLLSANRPPALRILISQYQITPVLGIFASQALSAQSWYQKDRNSASQAFSDMIESVSLGKFSIRDALENAQNKINF